MLKFFHSLRLLYHISTTQIGRNNKQARKCKRFNLPRKPTNDIYVQVVKIKFLNCIIFYCFQFYFINKIVSSIYLIRSFFFNMFLVSLVQFGCWLFADVNVPKLWLVDLSINETCVKKGVSSFHIKKSDLIFW